MTEHAKDYLNDLAGLKEVLGLPLEALEGAPGPVLLTCAEAAGLLRVGRSKLYDLIRRGEVVSVLIGGSRRIPRDALLAHLRLLTETATAQAEERRQQWRADWRADAQPRRSLSLPA